MVQSTPTTIVVLKYIERQGIKDLGHKKKNGDTRYNEGKHAEVDNRVKHFGCIVDGGE